MTYKLMGEVKSITPERALRMISLIDGLKQGTMSMREVGDCTGLGLSGSRKYMRNLVDNEIVICEGYNHGLRYSLTDDTNRVKWFVLAIMAPRKDGLPKARGRKFEEEGVHVMGDDEVFRIKRATWKLPAHEPVLAAFYGLQSIA